MERVPIPNMSDTSALEQFHFTPETEVICDEVVPSIAESHEFDADKYPTVVERFFQKHYYCKNESIDEMHTVLHHSNRVCLIGLADTHVAVRKGIQSITFDVGNVDRSKNHVKGKNKKGAMNMTATSCVAIVKCIDGSEYKIVSAVQGKLVEVNERLLAQPNDIGKDGAGYVAIILPKIERFNDIIGELLTDEQYRQKLSSTSNGDAGQIEL